MKTGNGVCPVLTAITVALFSGVCFAFNDTGFQYWSKAGVSTNINADEVFFNFDAEGYNKNRLYSGVSFDLSKNLKGDIFYIWQVSRSGGDHKEIHVLGNTLKLYF